MLGILFITVKYICSVLQRFVQDVNHLENLLCFKLTFTLYDKHYFRRVFVLNHLRVKLFSCFHWPRYYSIIFAFMICSFLMSFWDSNNTLVMYKLNKERLGENVLLLISVLVKVSSIVLKPEENYEIASHNWCLCDLNELKAIEFVPTSQSVKCKMKWIEFFLQFATRS